jgi:hypothetical protein
MRKVLEKIMLKTQLRILWLSFLLGDWKTLFEPVVDFLQRVWPFSRWDFTESARTRKHILTHLKTTMVDYYNDPEVRKQLSEEGK